MEGHYVIEDSEYTRGGKPSAQSLYRRFGTAVCTVADLPRLWQDLEIT